MYVDKNHNVSTSKPTELTYFEACWMPENGIEYAWYPKPNQIRADNCPTKPEIINWVNQLPIRVVMDPILPDDDKHAIRMAMAYWNITVGRDIFIESKLGADIVIQYSLNVNIWTWGILAATRHFRDVDHIMSIIEVFPILAENTSYDPDVVVQVYVHEFGHALGLTHDEDNPNSLMHPIIIPAASQEMTEPDLNFVREMYL